MQISVSAQQGFPADGTLPNPHASTSLLNDAHLFNVLHAIERTAEGVDLRAQPGGDVKHYLRTLLGQKDKRHMEQKEDKHRGGVKSAPTTGDGRRKRATDGLVALIHIFFN